MAKVPFNDGKMVVLKTATGEYSGGQGITITDKTINVNYDPDTLDIKSNGKLGAIVDIPVPPLEETASYMLICNVANGIPYYSWLKR